MASSEQTTVSADEQRDQEEVQNAEPSGRVTPVSTEPPATDASPRRVGDDLHIPIPDEEEATATRPRNLSAVWAREQLLTTEDSPEAAQPAEAVQSLQPPPRQTEEAGALQFELESLPPLPSSSSSGRTSQNDLDRNQTSTVEPGTSEESRRQNQQSSRATVNVKRKKITFLRRKLNQQSSTRKGKQFQEGTETKDSKKSSRDSQKEPKGKKLVKRPQGERQRMYEAMYNDPLAVPGGSRSTEPEDVSSASRRREDEDLVSSASTDDGTQAADPREGTSRANIRDLPLSSTDEREVFSFGRGHRLFPRVSPLFSRSEPEAFGTYRAVDPEIELALVNRPEQDKNNADRACDQISLICFRIMGHELELRMVFRTLTNYYPQRSLEWYLLPATPADLTQYVTQIVQELNHVRTAAREEPFSMSIYRIERRRAIKTCRKAIRVCKILQQGFKRVRQIEMYTRSAKRTDFIKDLKTSYRFLRRAQKDLGVAIQRLKKAKLQQNGSTETTAESTPAEDEAPRAPVNELFNRFSFRCFLCIVMMLLVGFFIAVTFIHTKNMDDSRMFVKLKDKKKPKD